LQQQNFRDQGYNPTACDASARRPGRQCAWLHEMADFVRVDSRWLQQGSHVALADPVAIPGFVTALL
jgi:hypothetical protein